MAIYEITPERIRPIDETSFGAAGIKERGDLQRLLRAQVEVIAPDTLVVAEEFGEWEDSRRRIDLLGVDRDANLVVIELKRTDDGGHMELQALRYAAMVSTMTFGQAVATFSRYLVDRRDGRDASAALLDHLGWSEPGDGAFAADVRIVLAAADFSRELTTTVLWLNGRGLGIRCVRMKPYSDGERLLIDIQQVIPLPDAEEYQVRLREKEQEERAASKERNGRDELFRKFWTRLLEYAATRTPLHKGRVPSGDQTQGQPANAAVPGLHLRYVLGKGHSRVVLALYDDRGKAAFDQLVAARPEIEAAFGTALEWERRDDAPFSRIVHRMPSSGVQNEDAWPELISQLVDAMIRFEAALRPHLDRLTL